MLLAPNGKPSNLNPEQYNIVRTPEFKKFFGDWERLENAKINDSGLDEVTLNHFSKDVSKVVDENGEPLVVYHRSKKIFSVFDTDKQLNGWLGKGFYFSESKFEFKDYGNKLFNVFLNIKNPFIVKGESPTDFLYELKEIFNSYDLDNVQKLKENSYDGVIYKHWDYESKIFSCFESSQIKLADGTNTTFDSYNPDIRFKKGGEINDEQKDIYNRWKELVNMSSSELKKFMDSDEGKEAGLSKKEADDLGIGYGRQSAKWILKMKEKPVSEWTPEMWYWAKRQISFISRMTGNKGELYDEKGNKTRKHLSLLIWGNNPEIKHKEGGYYTSVGLEGYLIGRSRNPYIGKEKEINCFDKNIRCFVSDYNDYRFIYVINNKNVSVIHIDFIDGKYTVRNIYTLESYRRKGIATLLFNEAKKHLGDIGFSTNLNEMSKGFIDSINKMSEGGETNSNENKVQKWVTCPKCSGSGELPLFQHINAGVCYECGGKGVVLNTDVEGILNRIIEGKKKYKEKVEKIRKEEAEKYKKIGERKDKFQQEFNRKIINEYLLPNLEKIKYKDHFNIEIYVKIADKLGVKNGEEFIKVLKDYGGKHLLDNTFIVDLSKFLYNNYNFDYISYKLIDANVFFSRSLEQYREYLDRLDNDTVLLINNLHKEYQREFDKIGAYEDNLNSPETNSNENDSDKNLKSNSPETNSNEKDIIALAKLKQKLRILANMLNYKTNIGGSLKEDVFIDRVVDLIYSGKDFKSKRDIESIAEKEFGFTDKQKVRELTEYAVLKVGRIISENYDIQEAYPKIVSLYSNQPYSTHRTSTSIALGQFSTPAPMAYLMGVYVGINNKNLNKLYFEPTAGNGMLTIAGNPKHFIVNELDKDRYNNLIKDNYKKVYNQDALKSFDFEYKFDGILANPPFATTKSSLIEMGFQISGLEQQIMVKSFNYLKKDSRSAFIIGGNTEYDDKGRLLSKKDKSFLSFLFKFYHLEDVINIDGSLYGRQGTTFPVRIILMRGKKSNPEGFYPLANNDLDVDKPFSTKIVKNFTELYNRVVNNLQ